MRRPLPLWLATVVPATIAGHALTYAFGGRSLADGHHFWLAPALECTIALLAVIAMVLVGGALMDAGIAARTLAQDSTMALWLRLSLAQVILFALIERAEGTSVGLLGCAVQIAVALLAAYLLTAFGRFLVTCVRATREASRYLQRQCAPLCSFVAHEPRQTAYALATRTGPHRFERPPPQH